MNADAPRSERLSLKVAFSLERPEMIRDGLRGTEAEMLGDFPGRRRIASPPALRLDETQHLPLSFCQSPFHHL